MRPQLARQSVVFASLVCIAACGSSSGGASSGPPTGPSPPAAVSLSINGVTFFERTGETASFSGAVRRTDGSQQTVTSEAAWQSSRPDVASVAADGVVTANAPGRARITASFGGVSGSMDVAVPLVGGATRVVRLVYGVPQGVAFRDDYRRALRNAVVNLQWWYRDQMGGPVFSLYSFTPDECQLPRDEAYYLDNTYSKVVSDTQRCQPIRSGSNPTTAWVLYVDLLHGCNAPGRLGVGSPGLTIMGRGDLQGLASLPVQGDCGPETGFGVGRYIGGAGHELGHAFGLPHPPGCDANGAACDHRALMWSGYSAYPDTYLRDDDKQKLAASPFFSASVQRLWDSFGMPRP